MDTSLRACYASKACTSLKKNRIYVNVKNVLFALAFWLFTFLTYYLSYYFSTDWNSGLPNAVFSISLIAAAVFYTCIMMIVSTRFISILKNKKRFNRYLSSKL